MNYGNGHTLYFLGIGGIGMSALARYFHLKGVIVYGYDRTRTILTAQLEEEGMFIHYEENISTIPKIIDLVIYTPAIPKDNKEMAFFETEKYRMMKRAEVLGALTNEIFTIAIAGTHGKTTITSMVTHLLNSAEIAITSFIGGVANNFNSNLVLHPDSKYMIVEADEYDKSFLQLKPSIAIISSMDADHLDVYQNHENLEQTFHSFAEKVVTGGTVILRHGLKLKVPRKTITYGIDKDADVVADDVKIVNGQFTFRLSTITGQSTQVKMIVPGRHNIENALAASAAALEIGIDLKTIGSALSTYTGVWRRFDIKVNTPDVVYIDDYAHHPAELRACIQATRELYPDKIITGVFQPHLYTRTRDFMNEFASSLALLDQLILLDIYPARELPIEGITSAKLLDIIPLKNKYLVNKIDLIPLIKQLKPQILLTLGAGDIDQLVEPLQHYFETC